MNFYLLLKYIFNFSKNIKSLSLKNYYFIVMKKETVINLSILILFLIFTKISYAQPGWRDYSRKISFTILNNDNTHIVFRYNKAYSIIFEDSIYTDNNIPTKNFIPAVINGYTFSYQITINDCKIQVPIKRFYERNAPLKICIVNEKDTMHLLGADNVQLKFEKGFFIFHIGLAFYYQRTAILKLLVLLVFSIYTINHFLKYQKTYFLIVATSN